MPARIRVTVEGSRPPQDHGRALQSEVLRAVQSVAPWVASHFHDGGSRYRPYAIAPVRSLGPGHRTADYFEVGVFEDRSAEAVVHALDTCDGLAPMGSKLRITRIDVHHLALADLLQPSPAPTHAFCEALLTGRGYDPAPTAPTDLGSEWWFEAHEPVVARPPDRSALPPGGPLDPDLLVPRAAKRLAGLLGVATTEVVVPPVESSSDGVRSVRLRPPKAGGPPEVGATGTFRLRTTEDPSHRAALAGLALTMLVLGAGDRTPIGRGVVVGGPVSWGSSRH